MLLFVGSERLVVLNFHAAIPLACGCCCGNVSPTEAALCIGAMEETKKKRH